MLLLRLIDLAELVWVSVQESFVDGLGFANDGEELVVAEGRAILALFL
jgi:hypothetical protein